MSYDENSPEARKGALGEAIVKEILESWGAVVTRPDEYGEKSLVDFLAVPDADKKFAARYVEVKVRSALPYAYGQYPCYTFPVVQIEAYKRYMDENNLPVELWLVDPEKAEILLGTLDERSPVCIEKKIFIAGREFPFDQKTKLGLMRFYHYAQFGGHFKISDDDLAKMRTIDSDKSTFSKEKAVVLIVNHKKQVQVQEQKAAVADKTLSLEIEDTLTTSNGTIIEILTLEGNTHLFIKAARLSSALGYANSSISINSPLMKAAERLKVTWYRFPMQRLSGDAAHTKKAYYFDLADVPKILAKYCELHCNAKSGSRQALYNSEAQKLRDWFQSFVLPNYPASNKVEPKLTAIVRPFESLHTPNGKQLSLFLTKKGAFLNLSQLESAGVELSCIRQRFELKNYGGEFAHYLSLSDAFSKSDASNLYDWWRNEGFPTVDKTSKEFSEAREFVLKHFGIDFPEELERLEQQDSEIIQSLRDKPMWLIFKTRSAFLRLNDKWKTKSFVARICNECAKIWEERPKILTKTPKVIVLDKVAKKVGELQTPNGATVELFTVEGNDKIFAHGAQLAVAASCPNQSGATSDSAGFSKAVNAVAQFYTVRRYNGGKPRRCVDVKDVPDVLNEYAFNQAFDHERYDTAMILLHWWIEQK